MENFWIRPDGQNTLKGVEDDPTNLPVLPAYLILEFLSNDNQKARDDFLKLLPSMTEDEQYRLEEIYAFSTKPKDYPQIVEDNFQKAMGTRVNLGNNHLPNKAVNTSSNQRSKLRVNQ
jgi:uncharacterized iron-regulated protein